MVQLLDSVVSLPQISEKDTEHMKLASMLECDFLIMNHTRNEKVLYGIKSRLKKMGMDKLYIIPMICSMHDIDITLIDTD